MSGPAPDGTRCSRVTARPDEVEGRRHPASESNRRLIGAGKGARLPLPPNRACASPAHGSPVSGFSSRLARQPSGFDQGEKPFGSEECIGPATVVGITPPKVRTFLLFAQERPQSSSDQRVQYLEYAPLGMLEVAIPSTGHRVEVSNDPPLTVASRAPRELAHVVFQGRLDPVLCTPSGRFCFAIFAPLR